MFTLTVCPNTFSHYGKQGPVINTLIFDNVQNSIKNFEVLVSTSKTIQTQITLQGYYEEIMKGSKIIFINFPPLLKSHIIIDKGLDRI